MKADTQQTLIITVLDGPPQVKTRGDVDRMTFSEFANLTAVSIATILSMFKLLPCIQHVQCNHAHTACTAQADTPDTNPKGSAASWQQQ